MANEKNFMMQFDGPLPPGLERLPDIEVEMTKDVATKLADALGGSPVLIEKSITENGTYDAADDDADGYSSVEVEVSGGGGGDVEMYFSGVFLPLSGDMFFGKPKVCAVNAITGEATEVILSDTELKLSYWDQEWDLEEPKMSTWIASVPAGSVLSVEADRIGFSVPPDANMAMYTLHSNEGNPDPDADGAFMPTLIIPSASLAFNKYIVFAIPQLPVVSCAFEEVMS